MVSFPFAFHVEFGMVPYLGSCFMVWGMAHERRILGSLRSCMRFVYEVWMYLKVELSIMVSLSLNNSGNSLILARVSNPTSLIVLCEADLHPTQWSSTCNGPTTQSERFWHFLFKLFFVRSLVGNLCHWHWCNHVVERFRVSHKLWRSKNFVLS